MKIKNVIIIPVTPNNGLVGFASITLGDDMALNSIAIYRKLDGSGYRLVYPTKSQMKMKYIFHPLTRQMSKEIEQAIFEECKNVFEKNCNDRYDKTDLRY